MAEVNRREFLAASAAVPMIGDRVSPILVGIQERDGETIQRHPNRDAVSGIISIYARVEMTGKEMSEVKDDKAWRKIIHDKCVEMEESLYQYVKKVANKQGDTMSYVQPDGKLYVKSMEKVNGYY